MSKSWLITGIVHEKPRLPPYGEYNGEDVYHPNQPTCGQIDEMLMQFSHTKRPVLVVCIDPIGCDTPEQLAEEVKNSVKWMFESHKGGNHNARNPQSLPPG